MGRIEWSRYSGEDIEHAIAMFIASEDQYAEKISPSRGDGGIDILVRYPRTIVYQVKGFSGPLKAGQKKQILDSMKALSADNRWSELDVDEWHLVMPWDPTPEAENWLIDQGKQLGMKGVVWDGMARCEAWAAKHHEITDYYFNGSRETVIEMADAFVERGQLRNLIPEGADKEIVDVRDSLSSVLDQLNRLDPHYTYGISTGPSIATFPEAFDMLPAPQAPESVFSTFQVVNGQLVRINVFAKSSLSTELRPISIHSSLTAVQGSPEHEAIQKSLRYGVPLHLESGVKDIEVDAPGGLSGSAAEGAIILTPSAGNLANAPELRIVEIDEGFDELGSLELDREYIGTGVPDDDGIPGFSTRLRDRSGALDIELLTDVREEQTTTTLSMKLPQGCLVAELQAVIDFYLKMKLSRGLIVAPRFGPIPKQLLSQLILLEPSFIDHAEKVGAFLNDLATIQEHVAFGVRVPSVEDISRDWIELVHRMAILLRDGAVSMPVESVRTPHESREKWSTEATPINIAFAVDIPLSGETAIFNCQYSFNGLLSGEAIETEDGLVDEWRVVDRVLKIELVE